MSNYAEQMLRWDMALSENGTPFYDYYTKASRRRGNKRQGDGPTDIKHLVLTPNQRHRLWITDRIMEPQTIPHFVEFLMHGELPNGRKTDRPLLTVQETRNMGTPFPDWAPAPFNVQARSTLEWVGIRIGSFEDSERLWSITKELHAMKSRIWEGLPPLSERRWDELQLNDPKNFSTTCRYFAAVMDVFAYLNNPRTKGALRTTYNLIWNHLKVFEQAVNARRRLEAEGAAYDEVSVTGLWYQYIRAHYDSICQNAHHWVTTHIDRIREPIILELGSHRPVHPQAIDAKQQELTDKIHDLAENTSQADYMIFLPTDGYKGDSLPAQEHKPITAAHQQGFREEPISWSANINWRALDLSRRVRFLSRKERYDHFEREGIRMLNAPLNDPEILVVTCISQIDGQTMARQELRGLSEPVEVDPWIEYARRPTPRFKGFVTYRLCHEHDDETWKRFKTQFEADIADWGRGKTGIDDVRRACKIHWVDGKDENIEDENIEATKSHFKSIVSGLPVHDRVFLVIDKATMESYLEPAPPKANFVLAVDATYEAKENVESPGYKGTLRILGSLLWDELSALLTVQSAFLENLWPFAMSDADKVYRGLGVGPVWKFSTYEETKAWEVANVMALMLVNLVESAKWSACLPSR